MSSTDPNKLADELAKLAKQLASAHGTFSSLPLSTSSASARETAKPVPTKPTTAETESLSITEPASPHDNVIAEAAVGTDNVDNVDNGDTQQQSEPEAKSVASPHVVIKGAKFTSKAPTHDDLRTERVIIARHVDPDRDESVGVAISTYNLNYVFAKPDEKDHLFVNIFGTPDPMYLPAATDLRPQWGEILDQLDLGSCVSNSVAYSLRYCFKKQKLGDFTPSRLFIYYNARQLAGYPSDEDTGLAIKDGYKSVTHCSTCHEEDWPYVPERFSQKPPERCYEAAKDHKTFQYFKLDNDADQIKKCLKDGYPVSFGAALFSSFMSAQVAKTGIIPMPDLDNDERVGGHAMTIVGHDDTKDAFLVVNNWGDSWGLKGYCWFPYDYMTNELLVGDLWSPRWFS